MTPVFACGFECGVLTNGASLPAVHWRTINSLATIDTVTVRSGARSCRHNITTQEEYCLSSAFANTTVMVARIYVRFATLPNANACICSQTNAAPTVGIFFRSSDSKLYCGSWDISNGFIFSTTTGVSVTTGVWYRVDMKINVAANPWLIDGQIDGTALSQHSFANSAGIIANFCFGEFDTNVTRDMYYDDIVVSATAADYPIGAGHVDHFVPTSDGTHNIAGAGDFQRGNTAVDILNATTTAFQLVDDVPLPTGTVDQADNIRGVAPANPTTDYVECVFGPAPGISTPTVAPRAVEVALSHHQISTTVGQMVVRLNDNGTVNDIFDTGASAGQTAYQYARKHYATAPTGGAWTVSAGAGNFNNIRMRFLAPDANPDQCLDAIMIEAEFAAGGALTLSVGDDLNATF